jgi:hypothetical protein
MKLGRRLAAALVVPALAGAGALGAVASANAAGFTDTSVQASNFVFQHHIVNVATAANATPGGVQVVDVTGLQAVPAPASGRTVTYAITGGADVDGVMLSVTNSGATTLVTGVISANGSFNAGATPPVADTVTLTATDQFGDVAVVTVPVKVGPGDNVSLGTGSVLTDEVLQITATNQNTDGSVLFAAKDTADVPTSAISESNLPGGLVSGNPLLPGTAVPGFYNDLQVTATDAAGAKATGAFLLKVNGGPTPPAPVPVLSHGAATFVAPTRENVSFDTTITTWVHFQIAGPGAINGHQGWVHAIAGQLNTGVYSGLEPNHTYAVFFTPVDAQGSSNQIVGTRTGHVTFISNRP